MPISDRRTGRGISLVELLIFIIVVGTAVAGVLSVMNLTTQKSVDPMMRKQAIAIAEGMLEEALLHDFSPPAGGFSGAATPANRPLFDDVGDYNGYASSGVYDLTGTALPLLAGYGVSVEVADEAMGPAGAQVPVGESKRVTVTVTAPNNETVKISGYRTHYGS